MLELFELGKYDWWSLNLTDSKFSSVCERCNFDFLHHNQAEIIDCNKSDWMCTIFVSWGKVCLTIPLIGSNCCVHVRPPFSSSMDDIHQWHFHPWMTFLHPWMTSMDGISPSMDDTSPSMNDISPSMDDIHRLNSSIHGWHFSIHGWNFQLSDFW